MASSLPTFTPIPNVFAYQGDKSNIPATVDTSTSAMASWQWGFPPKTAENLDDGGVPPNRFDMNALGYIATQPLWMLQQGAYFTFVQAVSDLIGGYPLGAVLNYYDSVAKEYHVVRSLKANNTANFNADPSYINGVDWEDVTPRAASPMPTGSIITLAAQPNNSPDGYLYCDGQAVSRSTYSNLFALLSTTYGAGDGTTTFNVPDFRGEFLRGYRSGVTSAPGTMQAAGLPNIKGCAGFFNTWRSFDPATTTAPFYVDSTSTSKHGEEDAGHDDWKRLYFDAKRSSAVYGRYASKTFDSDNVVPKNYAVFYYIKY